MGVGAFAMKRIRRDLECGKDLSRLRLVYAFYAYALILIRKVTAVEIKSSKSKFHLSSSSPIPRTKIRIVTQSCKQYFVENPQEQQCLFIPPLPTSHDNLRENTLTALGTLTDSQVMKRILQGTINVDQGVVFLVGRRSRVFERE